MRNQRVPLREQCAVRLPRSACVPPTYYKGRIYLLHICVWFFPSFFFLFFFLFFFYSSAPLSLCVCKTKAIHSLEPRSLCGLWLYCKTKGTLKRHLIACREIKILFKKRNKLYCELRPSISMLISREDFVFNIYIYCFNIFTFVLMLITCKHTLNETLLIIIFIALQKWFSFKGTPVKGIFFFINNYLREGRFLILQRKMSLKKKAFSNIVVLYTCDLL